MSLTENKYSLQSIHVAFIAILILAFTFTVLLNLKSETADEGFHTPQIWAFFHGDFRVAKELTMIPAYHAVIAGLLKTTDTFSVKLARFLHLLLSALALPVFYHICKTLKQTQADTRTLLFLCCPIILPFFSLIYTDLPALLTVLLAFLLTLQKRYVLAAIVGLLAILMRQTNLIWVAFCCVFILIEHIREHGVEHWRQQILPLVRKLWAYAVIGIGAVTYFYLKGGVAVGDSHQHQISFNLSNLYFFLLLTFVFLLPHNIAYAKPIIELLKTTPKVWYALGAAFIIYMATYSNSHQYNSFGLSFYLRNVILHYTVTFPIFRAIAFIPMAWMALTLFFFYKETDNKWLLGTLYLFGLLSFVPLPLVEQRYYLPALVLLFAIMPKQESKLDWSALFMFVPINCALLLMISRHLGFL